MKKTWCLFMVQNVSSQMTMSVSSKSLCVCVEIQKVTVWKKKRHQRQVKIGTIVGEMNPFHCHALQPSFLFLASSMFYDYFAFCCAFLLNHLTKYLD